MEEVNFNLTPAWWSHTSWNQMLRMLTPEILPSFPIINQSEECPWLDQVPCDPLPQLTFKSPSLKAIGDVRSFKHELPVLLVWSLVRYFAINTVRSFTTSRVSRLALLRMGEQTQVWLLTHVSLCLQNLFLKPSAHMSPPLGPSPLSSGRASSWIFPFALYTATLSTSSSRTYLSSHSSVSSKENNSSILLTDTYHVGR